MTRKIAAALGLCAIALGFALPASADLGPKPSMSFDFSMDGKNLTISKGTLFQCAKSDCKDAKPLEPLGPQRFSCNVIFCNAHSYGFSKYGMIEITFSDGRTLRSKVFETVAFYSSYKVLIEGAALNVVPLK